MKHLTTIDQKTANALKKELLKYSNGGIDQRTIPTGDRDLDTKVMGIVLTKITPDQAKVLKEKGMFNYQSIVANWDTISKEDQKKITKSLRKKIR